MWTDERQNSKDNRPQQGQHDQPRSSLAFHFFVELQSEELLLTYFLSFLLRKFHMFFIPFFCFGGDADDSCAAYPDGFCQKAVSTTAICVRKASVLGCTVPQGQPTDSTDGLTRHQLAVPLRLRILPSGACKGASKRFRFWRARYNRALTAPTSTLTARAISSKEKPSY